jgi:hypothetical protein
MKDIEINRNLKTGVQIILIIMVGLSLYSLFQAFQSESVIDKDIPACNYKGKSDFNYVVLLKPNSLFETQTISQNRTYFSKIIDRIDTIFYYEFSCNSAASIKGDYEVVASVNGDTWEKNFTLVPKTEFNGEKRTDFTVKFPVNITRYNDVLNSIGKEIDVQAKNPQLKLIYNINTIASIGGNQAKVAVSPTIIIPLSKSAFEISGDLSTSNTGTIFRKEVIVAQDVINKRIYSAITVLMSLLMLLLFTRFTRNSLPDKTRIKGIRNKYQDWIAEAKELPASKEMIKVSTMEDLVKITEELGKPILHVAKDKNHWYFVLDGQMMYEFQVNESDKNA